MYDPAQLHEGKEKVMNGCWVYFIKGGDYIKIGISNNPQFRLAELQVASPYKLQLLEMTWYESNSKAYAVEHDLHNHFQYVRAEGEWFEAPFVEAYLGHLHHFRAGATKPMDLKASDLKGESNESIKAR